MVVCGYKEIFLKDLALLPGRYRARIERLVFDQKKGDHRAPNRKVMIAMIMKIITRIFAISIENPATPLAPNM
jgi:hypothetical protein